MVLFTRRSRQEMLCEARRLAARHSSKQTIGGQTQSRPVCRASGDSAPSGDLIVEGHQRTSWRRITWSEAYSLCKTVGTAKRRSEVRQFLVCPLARATMTLTRSPLSGGWHESQPHRRGRCEPPGERHNKAYRWKQSFGTPSCRAQGVPCRGALTRITL